MAIKGKGRSKSKQVARAPRREPVEVPPPFVQRRWVQVTAAFVAGALVAVLVILVIAGLRSERTDKLTAEDQETRQAAAQRWKQRVTTTMAGVSSTTEGTRPVVTPLATGAIKALAAGNPAPDAAKALAEAQEQLDEAAGSLEDFNLAGAIRNQGFDSFEATAFTDSKSGLVSALRIYGRAAEVGAAAAGADGAEQVRLGKIARSLVKDADEMLADAWDSYVSALAVAGINDVVAPPQDIPSIPGVPPGTLPSTLPSG